MNHELTLENEKYAQPSAQAKDDCQRPARVFLYDTMETIGMRYGPTFRIMTELFAGPSASYGYPFVVHPATLDSALHLLFPSISGEDQSLNEAVVPFSFDRIFVSAKISTVPRTRLHGYSTAQRTSYDTWKSSITISEDLSEPMIIMEDARASCFTQTWHKDVDLLEPLQIKDLVYKRILKSQDDESVLDRLEFVCLVYIYRCLAWFESEEGKAHVPQDGFGKLCVEWVRNTVKEFPPLPSTESQVTSEMESSRASIVLSKSGDVTVQMVDRTGENISRIFTREVEPLQVMTEGDLFYDFYRGAFDTSSNTNVTEYVGLVADKSPGVKILEIGAGNGCQVLFYRYFSGIPAKAADRFSADASIMELKAFNIEKEPKKQGFSLESYDLIICANVLHAPRSIEEMLTHCNKKIRFGLKGSLPKNEHMIGVIGSYFYVSGAGVTRLPKVEVADTIGCGYDWAASEIYVTLNGELLTYHSTITEAD
ncbi:Polyketide synthase, dehydratase domain superfamily [Fusarium oxysporum f. sp. vasinfectum]|nr:Polyketide synthase, dehydratase domain superfamily [Fusarium oxysporum f. sp. vasinfectum]